MEGYDSVLAQLEVVVADYNSKKLDTWKSQSPKKKVERLEFLRVDCSKFENCLSYYDGELKKLLPNNPDYEKLLRIT